jgi:hypothetical protein
LTCALTVEASTATNDPTTASAANARCNTDPPKPRPRT